MKWRGKLPLLDLVEALQERNGDEDDDGLLALADFDLWIVCQNFEEQIAGN